jgi:hypothetical protein
MLAQNLVGETNINGFELNAYRLVVGMGCEQRIKFAGEMHVYIMISVQASFLEFSQ